MSFDLDHKEHINCNSYKEFLNSLVEWHKAGYTAMDRALSIFEVFSPYQLGAVIHSEMDADQAKRYCAHQEVDLVNMIDRRISAMVDCVRVQEDKAANLQDHNKAQLAKRDALLMRLEIKKQKAADYQQIKNFCKFCKTKSYGKYDTYLHGAFTDVKDGTLFEKVEKKQDIRLAAENSNT